MRKYSVIHALYMSLFSKSLYRDVGRNWKGLCIFYLLFLLSLLWTPEVRKEHRYVSEYLKKEAPHYIKQVPVIDISHGKASIKEPVPYMIYERDNETPFAIIDTSVQFASLENTNAKVLITEDRVFIRIESTGTREIPLSGIDGVVIDQKSINEWIDLFLRCFPFILFPFVLLFSFLLHLIQVLFCAFIGTLFAKNLGTNLSYQALVRLSVVSLTPAIFLQLLHSLLDIPFPYSLPISLFINLGYLYLAVSANAEKGGTKGERTY